MDRLASHFNAVGDQKMTVFTFDNRATLPPHQYYENGFPSNWNSRKLPSMPGGGTNFGQALIRAIEFIILHKLENTCFLMITDGEAEYPGL